MRVICFIFFCIYSLHAFSQSQIGNEAYDREEIQNIEKELEENLPTESIISHDLKSGVPQKLPSVDFQKLSEFSNKNTSLASLQRTYMPKTGRLMTHFQLLLNPSDAFYNSYGLSGHVGWSWNELFGAEVEAFILNSEKGTTAKDLESKQQVALNNLITLNGGYIATLNIYPIYGKLAVQDRWIVPMNIFFRIGGGKISTSTSGEVPTTNIGSGFFISLDRSKNIRADINLYLYQARDQQGTVGNQSTLMVSIGYGWLFPEPEYR